MSAISTRHPYDLRSWLFELNPLLVLFHTPLNLPLGMNDRGQPVDRRIDSLEIGITG